MKWVTDKDDRPINDVDVFVVTSTGKRGVARYWSEINKWLTGDPLLTVSDEVVKWKYENAKIDSIKGRQMGADQSIEFLGEENLILSKSSPKFSELPQHTRFSNTIDPSFLSAVDNYFAYGLHPGDCVKHVIDAEYMDAWFLAHTLIQQRDVWINYFELGEAIQRYKASTKGQ